MDRLTLWKVIFIPRFRWGPHVLVLGHHARGHGWVLADWRQRMLDLHSLNSVQAAEITVWVRNRKGTIVDLPPREAPSLGLSFGLVYCVTLVKHLIGCRSLRVWTPRQLYWWCLANGGTVSHQGEVHYERRRWWWFQLRGARVGEGTAQADQSAAQAARGPGSGAGSGAGAPG